MEDLMTPDHVVSMEPSITKYLKNEQLTEEHLLQNLFLSL